MQRLKHKLDYLVLRLSWGGRVFGRIDGASRRLHTPIPERPIRTPDRTVWDTRLQTTGNVSDAVLAKAETLGLVKAGDLDQPFHSDFELTGAGWDRAQQLQ